MHCPLFTCAEPSLTAVPGCRVLALVTKHSLSVPDSLVHTLYDVMRRQLPEANHIVMTRSCWIVNLLPVKPDKALQLQMADQVRKAR